MAVKESRSEKTQAGAGQKQKSAKTRPDDKLLKVRLVRSLIGRPRKQREVVKGLGLRKISSEVIRKDCPEIWGMIKKVSHLVKVEVVDRQ